MKPCPCGFYSGPMRSVGILPVCQMMLFLPSIGKDSVSSTTAGGVVLIEYSLPAVSFLRQTPSTSPTNADTLLFRVTFSEEVQNVDTADFTIKGATTAGVMGVSPCQRQHLQRDRLWRRPGRFQRRNGA
jgi:hypothetical protein